MALDMNNAKYARGGHGTEIALANEINQKFLRFKNAIRGEEYKRLISTIQDNWEGADSTKFQSIINQVATNLEKEADKYCSGLIQSILDDRTEFANFQQKNASTINNPNMR